MAMALISGLASAGMLVVTTALLRLDGARLGDLGLVLDRRRLENWPAASSSRPRSSSRSRRSRPRWSARSWQFTGLRGFVGALFDLPLVLCLVLAEELLFRGAALRSLRAIAGDRWAIGLTAVAFGVYHVLGTHYWAMGLVFQFLMPAIGGLLFAWAAVRSGGLALPIGLHLGGNWVQASVAVFTPQSATGAVEPIAGLWRIAISATDVQTLTAPDLLPRLPLLVAFAITAAVTWQWLRRRTGAQFLAASPKQ